MSDPVTWDAGLVSRYDHAGPLYRAYPGPAQYRDAISPRDLGAALENCGRLERPLSLYIHIPFCASACHHCSRTRLITRDRSRVQSYLAALYQEMELVSSHLQGRSSVERLHLGGGTPTLLDHGELAELMGRLRRHFRLRADDNAVYSVSIDPREADWSTLGQLRELGFNHLHLEVPDLDQRVLLAVNRRQNPDQTRTMMDAARALAYRSVSMDLLYGLPGQTSASFARTLDQAVAMKPDRLSLHRYLHRPERHAPQRHIRAAELPGRDECLSIFGSALHRLQQADYRFIGMGQFAMPDDSLSLAREAGMLIYGLQGYVAGVECDLIGLGASAISRVGGVCWRNDRDVERYRRKLSYPRLAADQGRVLTTDDRLRRVVIQQLLCRLRLDYRDIEQRFGIDFQIYFADCQAALRQMDQDGLIRLAAQGIEVLPAGWPLVARVCSVFDAYLPVGAQPVHAQII
ncbi:oxygen-independent coproporphyrinogen III oxidase [Halopseudomonas pertucinogena]|uniref:Coproporphyrinogen-III oxidase n=1 Tax=Halopseudomonas pertucinogena TaxID=86175 RepID=A0ABQ2CL39_9GAMM|nr:oxygen-independent coproporphyrinogen III oxidase [Halopseudomonas pertucinogena]GGI93318.1 oxygen-independent coproporphyrinogen III oxidase [Halopseudomonas pertucinogena]